ASNADENQQPKNNSRGSKHIQSNVGVVNPCAILRKPSLLSEKLEEWKEFNINEVYDYSDIASCLGNCLGSGVYGSVYMLHKNCDDYCIKLFKNVKIRSLVKEVSTLLSLREIEGIPRVIGVCKYPPGMIMSQHDMTLNQWRHNNKPSSLDLVQVALHVCTLVRTINQNGFRHNDIKCNNVMVDLTEAGPKVMLIDFELANKVGRSAFRGRERIEREELERRWKEKKFYA
ncbi:hypothetical protein SK128_020415, partial [Halocaridina rubra]